MGDIGEEIEEIEYDSPFVIPAPVEPLVPTPIPVPDRELEPV